MTSKQANAHHDAMIMRFTRYCELRNAGMSAGDAAAEVGVSPDAGCAGDKYDRAWRRLHGLVKLSTHKRGIL